MMNQTSTRDFELTNAFVARDRLGNEISMDEYLHFASLSPWVPCPDPVAIRALDIAKVSSDDIHYELGSGDGRMNFHAIGTSYNVKKSVGIDIDPSLIERSNQRKARIHPCPAHLQFLCADLIDLKDSKTAEIWDKIKEECTVLTMYFVEDALLKIKPLIEEKLIGSSCRVITIGYPMSGWEPVWFEVLLGLKIYMYDISNPDELYNRLEPFDSVALQMDKELNILSKQKIRSLEEEAEKSKGTRARNPFVTDKSSTCTEGFNTDSNEDFDEKWDFDENIEYDHNGDKK
jgi:hypothetical protein